ncbi:LysE/ArgO family amino acid transporter [Paenibacillus tepidiphilus]|uniref:LysE/ArgO family amino acid transporter n=1 Tax=Paenibacillus tepidiphilus TaxID=2608683 RepID=UPI0012390AFF|nr:LysE/ArgO family amino acid transporter [Paenibacillus tepidiphilus]
MTEAIIHGLVLALGLILPLGVQNIFVFNQGALHSQFRHALPVVLTASLCDTLLIGMAVGGLSLVLLSLEWLTAIVYAAGVVFLCYMGWSIWHAAAPVQGEARRFTRRGQVGYALSVSLLNPHALLDTLGVIGTNSLQYSGWARWVFAGAAAGVSWIWFLGLAAAGRLLGRLDKAGRFIGWLNRASAVVIWAIALYMAFQLWSSLL